MLGDLPHIPFPAKIRIAVLPAIDLRELFGDEPDWDEAYGYVTSVMQVALSKLAAKTVARWWADGRRHQVGAGPSPGRSRW